jgi:hypothetical protein
MHIGKHLTAPNAQDTREPIGEKGSVPSSLNYTATYGPKGKN